MCRKALFCCFGGTHEPSLSGWLYLFPVDTEILWGKDHVGCITIVESCITLYFIKYVSHIFTCGTLFTDSASGVAKCESLC